MREPGRNARNGKPGETSSHVADPTIDAGLENHRELPKGQQQGHPRRLSPIRCTVSAVGLFGENLVAIDGRKFKAVNNCARNFTSAKLKWRMEKIVSSINRYALDDMQ